MTTWAVERARFNHDRLKNQFMQSLLRAIRALQGTTSDDEFVEAFLGRLSESWQTLEAEALAIVAGAEPEIGPATWFRLSPLNRVSRDDRQWMESLLRDDWRFGGGTRSALDAIRAAIRAVTEQCRSMSEIYALQPAGGSAGSHRAQALDSALQLHARCARLSMLMSRLGAEDPIDALNVP